TSSDLNCAQISQQRCPPDAISSMQLSRFLQSSQSSGTAKNNTGSWRRVSTHQPEPGSKSVTKLPRTCWCYMRMALVERARHRSLDYIHRDFEILTTS